jgi:hypothetical protein
MGIMNGPDDAHNAIRGLTAVTKFRHFPAKTGVCRGKFFSKRGLERLTTDRIEASLLRDLGDSLSSWRG